MGVALGVALVKLGVALGPQGFLDTNMVVFPTLKGFALRWNIGLRYHIENKQRLITSKIKPTAEMSQTKNCGLKIVTLFLSEAHSRRMETYSRGKASVVGACPRKGVATLIHASASSTRN